MSMTAGENAPTLDVVSYLTDPVEENITILVDASSIVLIFR